jgi:hypothetical protein
MPIKGWIDSGLLAFGLRPPLASKRPPWHFRPHHHKWFTKTDLAHHYRRREPQSGDAIHLSSLLSAFKEELKQSHRHFSYVFCQPRNFIEGFGEQLVEITQGLAVVLIHFEGIHFNQCNATGQGPRFFRHKKAI